MRVFIPNDHNCFLNKLKVNSSMIFFTGAMNAKAIILTALTISSEQSRKNLMGVWALVRQCSSTRRCKGVYATSFKKTRIVVWWCQSRKQIIFGRICLIIPFQRTRVNEIEYEKCINYFWLYYIWGFFNQLESLK